MSEPQSWRLLLEVRDAIETVTTATFSEVVEKAIKEGRAKGAEIEVVLSGIIHFAEVGPHPSHPTWKLLAEARKAIDTARVAVAKEVVDRAIMEGRITDDEGKTVLSTILSIYSLYHLQA